MAASGDFGYAATAQRALDSVADDFRRSMLRGPKWLDALAGDATTNAEAMAAGERLAFGSAAVDHQRITKNGRKYQLEDSQSIVNGRIQYYGYGVLIGTSFCLLPAVWFVRHRIPRVIVGLCVPLLLLNVPVLYRDMSEVGRELEHLERVQKLRAAQREAKERLAKEHAAAGHAAEA